MKNKSLFFLILLLVSGSLFGVGSFVFFCYSLNPPLLVLSIEVILIFGLITVWCLYVIERRKLRNRIKPFWGNNLQNNQLRALIKFQIVFAVLLLEMLLVFKSIKEGVPVVAVTWITVLPLIILYVGFRAANGRYPYGEGRGVMISLALAWVVVFVSILYLGTELKWTVFSWHL